MFTFIWWGTIVYICLLLLILVLSALRILDWKALVIMAVPALLVVFLVVFLFMLGRRGSLPANRDLYVPNSKLANFKVDKSLYDFRPRIGRKR